MAKVYLCLKCGNIYDSDHLNDKSTSAYTKRCPNIKCGHRAFEIDENMIPIILELNRRGYITEYCCSAHVFDMGDCDLYIKFDKDAMQVILNGIINNYIKELPYPFIISGDSIRVPIHEFYKIACIGIEEVFEREGSKIVDYKEIIDESDTTNYIKKMKTISNLISLLYLWISELEPIHIINKKLLENNNSVNI